MRPSPPTSRPPPSPPSSATGTAKPGRWHNLGVALQEARRFDEAITAHQQAAALFSELGDRHGEALALDNLGSRPAGGAAVR